MRKIHEKADAVALIAEVFREFGYEGATLARITARTGLGKGSLYHFFPDGKPQMGREILRHIDGWFAREIFEPLERDAPRVAIAQMWSACDAYFQSGRKICLVGAFALDDARENFAAEIHDYFARWVAALAGALARAGLETSLAQALAEEAVAGLQGALVLARAQNEPAAFARRLAALAQRLDGALGAAAP